MTGKLGGLACHIEFCDQDSTVVSNTMAHTQNMAVGDYWKFTARTPVTFARAQVSQVQVFLPTTSSLK